MTIAAHRRHARPTGHATPRRLGTPVRSACRDTLAAFRAHLAAVDRGLAVTGLAVAALMASHVVRDGWGHDDGHGIAWHALTALADAFAAYWALHPLLRRGEAG